MSGYARFHRSLIGHPAFRNDAEAMAFAYMVLRAAWKPVRVRYKGKALGLDRGQLAMSIRDMADALDRDKGWVERLLKRLKSETMVETRAETGVLVITICNYAKYQAGAADSETVTETPARQTQDTEQVIEEGKKVEEEVEAAPQLRAARQPISEALSLWNETAAAVGWATVVKFTADRQAKLRTMLRAERLEGWEAGIARARASPYLAGRDPPSWFDFDFIVKPGNFAKLIEGKYDRDRSSTADQRPRARSAVDDAFAGMERWPTAGSDGGDRPLRLASG